MNQQRCQLTDRIKQKSVELFGYEISQQELRLLPYILYEAQTQWCKNRTGQVVVCEGEGANWLPFVPLTQQRTNKKMSSEMIWSNMKTNYDNQQQKLFEYKN